MEPRIRELREDFALRKIPTASFAANALYLEIVRLAYNLVTAFQRSCLDESWQNLTSIHFLISFLSVPGSTFGSSPFAQPTCHGARRVCWGLDGLNLAGAPNDLIKSGKTAPSRFLHKQLDITYSSYQS